MKQKNQKAKEHKANRLSSESALGVLIEPVFLAKFVIGIGEAADITDVPQRKIRYWEEKGLIASIQGSTGSTRRYDYINVRKIMILQTLLADGFTLDAAAKKLGERIAPITAAYEQVVATLSR